MSISGKCLAMDLPTKQPADGRHDGSSRRSLISAGAWTVPVIAFAHAAPAAQASGPKCPTCLKAGVLPGILTSQAVVLGGKGALLFAGSFALDAKGCSLTAFQPAYSVVTTSATLTMSDGSTHTGSGLGTGAGTFGQIGAIPGSFLFSNVSFPNGTYVATTNPVRPVKLTVTVNVIVVGLPGLISLTCPQALSWNLNVFGTGIVVFGAGTINYSGSAMVAP